MPRSADSVPGGRRVAALKWPATARRLRRLREEAMVQAKISYRATWPRMKNEYGLTLLGLLAAMAIVSIMSAVSISQYSEYKVRAYNAMALSALRNTVSAEEDYQSQHGAYPVCAFPISFGGPVCSDIMGEFHPNPDVVMLFNIGSSTTMGVAGAYHKKGNLLYQAKYSSKGIISLPFNCSGSTEATLATIRASNVAYDAIP